MVFIVFLFLSIPITLSSYWWWLLLLTRQCKTQKLLWHKITRSGLMNSVIFLFFCWNYTYLRIIHAALYKAGYIPAELDTQTDRPADRTNVCQSWPGILIGISVGSGGSVSKSNVWIIHAIKKYLNVNRIYSQLCHYNDYRNIHY